MIKPGFVSFTARYCEEVCTKYPGTELSHQILKCKKSHFLILRLSLCRNRNRNSLNTISGGRERGEEGGREGDRQKYTWGHHWALSNKQMPGPVWGRLFSPVRPDLPGLLSPHLLSRTNWYVRLQLVSTFIIDNLPHLQTSPSQCLLLLLSHCPATH